MKSLLLPVLFVCILSCKSSVPKDVLPPLKMQAVLWDMIQADEMAEYYSTSDSSFKEMARHVEYYQKIFAIHKIGKEDFTRSLAYYQDHPSRLKPILDSLQRVGQRWQATDSVSTKPHNKVANDTIKRKLPIRIRPT